MFQELIGITKQIKLFHVPMIKLHLFGLLRVINGYRVIVSEQQMQVFSFVTGIQKELNLSKEPETKSCLLDTLAKKKMEHGGCYGI